VLRARRLVNSTFLLVLASLVIQLLPAPWSAASIAFALAALVVAVGATLVGHRARAGTGMLLAGGVMIVVAGSGVMIGAVSLLMLPAQMTYERCQAGAVTVSGERACAAAYDDAVSRLRDQMTVLPTPR